MNNRGRRFYLIAARRSLAGNMLALSLMTALAPGALAQDARGPE